MRRSLVFVPVVALALAGCGADTCRSEPADAAQLPSSCSVPAASVVAIDVQLCASCRDSSPSCVAEFVNGELQLDTAFQRCEASAGCSVTSGCDAANSRVRCTVQTPPASGTYSIVAGQNQLGGTIVVGSGGTTTCTL